MRIHPGNTQADIIQIMANSPSSRPFALVRLPDLIKVFVRRLDEQLPEEWYHRGLFKGSEEKERCAADQRRSVDPAWPQDDGKSQMRWLV